MSDKERTGARSLVYSGWHRIASIERYVGHVTASKLAMIDIDACEYCCYCRHPIALIETQESAGPPKPARVMSMLARMAGIPAFSVSVLVVDGDIAAFQLKQLTPVESHVAAMTPREYAHWLLSLRNTHTCVWQVAS